MVNLLTRTEMAAGTRLGPYEILALLGAGSMGEVYRARDTRLDRQVAVKVLGSGRRQNAAALRRFEHEARAASALTHPNILAVHDVGDHEGTPYIVAELLEGESLRERLRSGPVPVRRAVDYGVQAARALAAAHDKGIVHRDVKPENLFLTVDGRLKVLDFGVAKLRWIGDSDKAGSVTAAGTFVGTAAYMSPEQVRGQPVDHRSDIFSLGAVLYEMLTGVRAFDGESHVEIGYAILNDDPPPLAESERDIPVALQRIVMRCVEKQKGARFQSASDLAFDLEALSTMSETGPRRAFAPTRAPAWRRLAVAAGVLVAALAFAAGTYAVGRRAGPPAAPALAALAPAARPVVPVYEKLTFRQGNVTAARFAPGDSVLYAAVWSGAPLAVYSTIPGAPESRELLGTSCDLLAVSSRGDLAVLVDHGEEPWQRHGTLARVPMAGGAPRKMLEKVFWADFGPDGDELAVARLAEQRVQVEYPIGRALYATSEGWVGHLRVSPRGDRVAFIDHPLRTDDMGYVAVVDHAGKARRLTERWASIQGLAWAPEGEEIWFTAAERGMSRALWAVTLEGTVRLVTRVPGVLTLHDISRDHRILLARDQGRMSVNARSGGDRAERDLSWLDWALLADMARDGSSIVTIESGDGSSASYALYLRRTDGSPAVLLGSGGLPAALSPDGRWLLAGATAGPRDLVLIPTGAGQSRTVPVGERILPHDLAWLPDGRSFLVHLATQDGKPHIFRLSIAGGKRTAVAPAGYSFAGPQAISPDGKQLIVRRGTQHYILPLDGGQARPIRGLGDHDRPHGWTADGRHLWIATSLVGEKVTLQRLNPVTGTKQVAARMQPPDHGSIVRGIVTPGGSFAYSYMRTSSELYLASGLPWTPRPDEPAAFTISARSSTLPSSVVPPAVPRSP